jgi:capsular exopolysaccharide synthesis family protein
LSGWVDRHFPVAGSSPPELEPESDFDLTEYLRKLRQRWRLIALCVATAVAVATVQFLITPEEYQAAAVIQIERRTLAPLSGSQNPWLENWWNLEYYPTQYQLLQSRGLAERVVQHLRLGEDSYWNGAAAQRRADDPPSALADEAALGHLADRVRGGLTVEPVERTQLVRLLYRSSDPVRAAQLANGFAEAFIDAGIESRTETVGRASTFLTSQIETLKGEIREQEVRLETFSRDRDIVAFEAQGNVVYQRLEALNRDYIEAKRERLARQARYEELKTAPRETVADLYAGAGLVGQLLREQLELERNYETRLKRFKPDWPEMVELRAEVDKGRQHLESVIDENARKAREAAYAEYQGALRQEQSLEQELNRLKEEAMDQNSAAVGYANLRIEVESRRELLDDLMRQQSETGVVASLQIERDTNVRIVDRALVPPGPFRPSLRRNLSLGLAMGLALGVGLVFALDFLDRTLKTPEEIERYLGLATLGVIPDLHDGGASYGYRQRYGAAVPKSGAAPRKWLDKKPSAAAPAIELVPHHRPRVGISEAYRGLRTALLLSSADELRLLCVTSATASEGKTATSSNLAVVLAQLGRRVLIIDGDLRKPRIQEVFRISNRDGLVNYLTGGATLEQVVHGTQVPGLYVTPSGPIPPNPSELLSSERMAGLLAELRNRFDLVILDTPPVLAVTDAILVGSQADGTVLCLRAGRVPREEARNCYRRLRLAGVRVLGTVLNGYRSRERGGNRYRYYEASYGSGPDSRAS